MSTYTKTQLQEAVAEAILHHPEIINNAIREAGGWHYWLTPDDICSNSSTYFWEDAEPNDEAHHLPDAQEARDALTSEDMDYAVDYTEILDYVHELIKTVRNKKKK